MHVREGPQDSGRQPLFGFHRVGTVGGSHRATTAATVGTAARGSPARLSGEVIFRFAPTCAATDSGDGVKNYQAIWEGPVTPSRPLRPGPSTRRRPTRPLRRPRRTGAA